MAKGQRRSNREKKKPKQAKAKPAPSTSRFTAPAMAGDAVAPKKKW